MTIRCPQCEIAILSTPTISIRAEKRTRKTIPIKTCARCKVIMILEKTKNDGWKIWRGKEYL